ncbi:MAG: 3-keto-disaccharide hydrolase [Bryobacteraceae bacterium]
MKRWLTAAVLLSSAFAADNRLSPEEAKAGWVLLFDGRTMKGWRDPAARTPPGDAWTIEDGCLTTRPGARLAEDLLTAESYGNFELVFDWRVSPRGNTGVKYRVQRLIFLDESRAQPGPGGFEGMLGREFLNPRSDRARLAEGARGQEYVVAFEMQLIDDEGHPDANNGPDRRAGALYAMLPPSSSPARPAGEWNTGRIVVRGDQVEHWINGVKVLEGSLRSPAVQQGIARRWRAAPEIGRLLSQPKPAGPISLQYHGDKVWFRNLKLRRL